MQWIPFLPWYPVYGGLFIFLAILIGIWFVMHIERSPELSWIRLVLSVALIAIFTGIGLHLIFLSLGL
jgi:hypothetical protein